MREVYLDHASNTGILPQVREAMESYLAEPLGNPQSQHHWGERPRVAIEKARENVASLVGGESEEILFTSGGTEANNLAIKGLARGKKKKGQHLVVSAIEHFSVLNSARTLEKEGFEVTTVPVDRYGVIDHEALASAIRDDTILVSLMLANAEVGTIEPIARLAKVAKEKEVLFHTDAVAATGNIPIDVESLGVDCLSLAANQFYGPPGVGALWVRKKVRLIPLLDGGIQEGGKRSGTENVIGIVGMGEAARLAGMELEERSMNMIALRDELIGAVLSKVEYTFLTGHPQERLPGQASFCVQFIEGEAMLMLLDMEGIGVASGSACTSRALKASHVLNAMGIPAEAAQGSLVLTLGLENNHADIEYVAEVLPRVVKRLREMSPLYDKYLKGEIEDASVQ